MASLIDDVRDELTRRKQALCLLEHAVECVLQGGSAENAVVASVADYRRRGVDAMPYLSWRGRNDGRTYFLHVMLPDRTIIRPTVRYRLPALTRG